MRKLKHIEYVKPCESCGEPIPADKWVSVHICIKDENSRNTRTEQHSYCRTCGGILAGIVRSFADVTEAVFGDCDDEGE